MKVILLRDVAKIGRRYEVKEVPTGHALNFLIPRKLAEPATPENLRRVKDVVSKHAHSEEVHTGQFADALKELSATPLIVSAQANTQGHLFSGVHAEDIVKSAAVRGVALEVSEIVLPHALKELGTHEVTLSLRGKTGTIKVEIVGQ